MGSIKPNSFAQFKYYGDFIPFFLCIKNLDSGQQAQYVLSNTPELIGTFQVHDSIEPNGEKNYWLVWSKNIGTITNLSDKSTIYVSGDGIYMYN